jgi:acylphosphatase
MAEVARKVRVTGRVQGVFFRQWTCEEARQLGVKGWVWNHPDGSVQARLEGEESAVKQLIDRMNDGPPSAVVEGVQVNDVGLERFERFEVRH